MTHWPSVWSSKYYFFFIISCKILCKNRFNLFSYFFYNFTKIKTFECPKSIRNYEKKIMLGTSDTWSLSRLSHRPIDPAYYIEDCRIFAYHPHLGVLFLSFDLCNKQFITFYFLPLHFAYRQPILNKRFPKVHFMPLLTIKIWHLQKNDNFMIATNGFFHSSNLWPFCWVCGNFETIWPTVIINYTLRKMSLI